MALRHRSRDWLDPHDENDGRRSSRVPLIVAAIALLGLGIWIGRASQPRVEEGAEPQPLPAPDQEAPMDWPGPTDTDNGVPVGYARTKAGAVAAAVQYATAAGQGDAERLAEVLDVIAADSAGAFKNDMEGSRRSLEEGLGFSPNDPDYVVVNAVAGYLLDSYTREAATVQVWGTGFIVDPQLGTPGAGLGSGWSTTTLGLQWERGDWRLAAFRTADGPSPEDANTGDPRRTGRAMNEFKELWHVPPTR